MTKTYEEAAEFLVQWTTTLKNNPTVRYIFSVIIEGLPARLTCSLKPWCPS